MTNTLILIYGHTKTQKKVISYKLTTPHKNVYIPIYLHSYYIMNKENKQLKNQDVHTDSLLSSDDINKETAENLEEIKEKIAKIFAKHATTKDGRSRAYAFMLYEESMADNWREILTESHVPIAVAYHDKDTNPDGQLKKPHYHVLMSFDAKKSVAQIVDIVARIVANTGGVPSPETVGSLRGYTRYLTHMDNPEKYQYTREALQLFNGFEYDTLIAREDDDFVMLGEIFQYVDDNDIRYTSELMRKLKVDNFDLFKLACKRTYAVVEYIKSYAYEQQEKAVQSERKRFDKTMYESDNDEFYDALKNLTDGDNNGN